MLNKLYHTLISANNTTEIRAWALENFVLVSDSEDYPSERYDILKLGELENPNDFNKAVNWNRVDRIMKEYVPRSSVSTCLTDVPKK